MAARRRPQRGASGQHFLRSSRLAAELVRDSHIAPGELVVDIGAGTGALTRALVDAQTRVVALEIDPALASELRRRFEGQEVTVLEVDARRWNWPREPFSVVSNLPFAASGAILSGLLRDPRVALRQADVIVQWDLATKHSAVWPATLRGTYWRAWFELTIVARLSRSAFSPVPHVDAGLLRIERRSRLRVAPEDHERYWQFVAGAFRAQAPLGMALRRQVTPRQLRRLASVLGFDPTSFPRDLDARQWARLFALRALRRPGSSMPP